MASTREYQFVLHDVADDRLQKVLREVRSYGVRASRSDVVGALIVAADPDDGENLAKAILEYRHVASVTRIRTARPRPPGPQASSRPTRQR
jgi:hypothetical protein